MEAEVDPVPLTCGSRSGRSCVIQCREGVRRGIELNIDIAHVMPCSPRDGVFQLEAAPDVDANSITQRHRSSVIVSLASLATYSEDRLCGADVPIAKPVASPYLCLFVGACAVPYTYRENERHMREPLTKFPKRPTGPDQTRRTLAECRAMLANPRLSPEMRQGLQARVTELEAELRADATHRARGAELEAGEPGGSPRPRRH